MTPRRPSPKFSWLQRLSLGLAVAVGALGAITAVGWWARVDDLLQPFGAFASLPINGAVGFGMLGVGWIGLELGKRRVGLVAWFALAIGFLTLIEHLAGCTLHIDQLLATDRGLTPSVHPGRMGVAVSLSLVLGGLLIGWRCTDCAGRGRRWAEATVGSLLTSVGLSALLGYVVDLPAAYTWGTAIPTTPVSALAITLLGAGCALIGWRESRRAGSGAPAWSPLPAVTVGLVLTVVLWLGLRHREHANLSRNAQAELDQFVLQCREVLDRQAVFLERVARSWADLAQNSQASRIPQTAERPRETMNLAVHLLDSSFHEVSPASVATLVPTLDQERRAALQRAAASGRPEIVMDASVSGADGIEPGLALYAPALRSGAAIGFVGGEISYRAFFQGVIGTKGNVEPASQLVVRSSGETIFQSSSPGPKRTGDLTLERTFTLADRRLQSSLTRSKAALAHDRRRLPELALGAGFGLTLLLGLCVHLARSARAGQRAAERSSARLSAENEERRRVEARLKVSDERLRLALDSTQIGIFEWNVSAGSVYYSPGLWAMLGYDYARMPSTVEVWQSLVHPEDLPLYRRRTESQLTGVAPFLELEYRVHGRKGDWRWVYVRSRTVATHRDERATQIIGTVQDITARREAELALQESQSEARKLSLVAAKTGSPVLIGSPDGRIEWANEAFCRTMEYRLDEVVGKNPIHFLVGPETSSRTLARIRRAMARGESVSTELVNYSKSGRKFHLHVEIQPVRHAAGAVTNFIAVETDISARVATEHELRRAKAEADEASRAKSEFLASMSHEIRTPMNGVIGMTSLLTDTPLSPEQRDCVNTIRTSGEALLTIINDILDFSKIESGKMELECFPFELALCLEEALDLFALQASTKRLELAYHIAPDVPAWIMGDPTRLRQVLVNLVNNAVKFTPGGSVSVEVRRADRPSPPPAFAPAVIADPAPAILEVTVRDTGIGIAADRMDRLFKAFSQVDSSTTRKFGGTGLGLAISRRLCELMGGSIRAESSPGRGTTFMFTLRTTAAPASDAGLGAPPEALRGGWALCIEQHPVTQARLRTLFQQWGVDCVVAPDLAGARAATAPRPNAPALLVANAAGLFDGAPPLEAFASLACPRLVMFPFGQPPPTAPAGSPPFASITKPIRTSSFILGICGLFQSAARDGTGAVPQERPIGEDIPLEVLLAEDNTVNQKVALRFLERLGYRADAVANGLEAITTLESRRYDLVLMDLQMPEMDGFEATRQIRVRLPSARQPKIVALTANAIQGDRERCVAAGMDDYISKPVKLHEIAAAIRRHFGKSDETPKVELIG